MSMNFAQSIFTPFTGIPDVQETINTTEDKLTLKIAGLEKQHEAVRKNMLAKIQTRGDEMIKNAEAEIESLGMNGVEDENEGEEGTENRHAGWKETQELIERLKSPMKEGAKASDYEEKIGRWSWTGKPEPKNLSGRDRRGDMNMDRRNRRTVKVIRRELSSALKDIIEEGLKEMAKYDKHAADTLAYYDNALKKERARFGREPPARNARSPTSSATVASPPPPRPGILKNKGPPSQNPGWVDPRRG